MSREEALRLIQSYKTECQFSETGAIYIDPRWNKLLPYGTLEIVLSKSIFGTYRLAVSGQFDAPYDQICTFAQGDYTQHKDEYDRIIVALRILGARVSGSGANKIDISSIKPAAQPSMQSSRSTPAGARTSQTSVPLPPPRRGDGSSPSTQVAQSSDPQASTAQKRSSATQKQMVSTQEGQTLSAQDVAAGEPPEIQALLKKIDAWADCNKTAGPEAWPSPIHGKQVVWASLKPETLDRIFWKDNTRLFKMLDFVAARTAESCKKEMPQQRLPDLYAVYVNAMLSSKRLQQSFQSSFLAWKSGRNSWVIQNDNMVIAVRDMDHREAELVARQQRAEQEAQAQAVVQKRLAEIRVAQRSKFISDFGVQSWPRFEEVMANPFRFENSVVGMYGLFVRMLSEREAIFDSNIRGSVPAHVGDIIVSDVPTTQFRGNEQAILAIKVAGTRKLKTAQGEISVPDLRLVGTHVCKQDGCKDFLN